MAEPIIRQVRREDAPALAALWHAVFGDPEELSRGFLEALPSLGGGVCAEEGGKLLGAAYAVTDYFLNEERLAYLYAVAVLPEARGRGLGAALSREAAALGRRLGAELVCTCPAEPGLYPWYEGIIGVRPALRRREEELACRPGPALRPLSPEEYGARREALLGDTPHVRPGEAALRREKDNCRSCGGDLVAVGEGIAAVYCEEGVAVLRELLAPREAERPALAAAVGAALGAERALLYTPDPAGEPCMAADRPLPAGCVWGLALD
ncbi:MAG: GNAT family N-acetyltransferase [Oscillospiraceae bacterium]|nr:GNAT family N-acetyltransferase [Oscillospiraceae bacterium]